MYKDSDPEKIRIINTFKETILDIQKGYLIQKTKITSMTLILAITGLFLNIETDKLFLKRVQALLVLLSVFTISWLLISIFKLSLQNKHSELYMAITSVFLWISGLLIYNLFKFVFTNFKIELTYYLEWLIIPIIALILNLLFIYLFKFIKRIKNIEGSQLEYFFLVSLNFMFILKYTIHEHDLIATIKSFDSSTGMYLVYMFLIILYDEFYLWDKFKKMKTLLGGMVYLFCWILILSLPYIITCLIQQIQPLI